MNKIICIDTETGGLSPFKSALCSVTLKIVGEDIKKTIYIEPTKNREYNEKAFKVNNLSKEYLNTHGISEEDAAYHIEDFIKVYGGFKPIFLGHNAIFDIQFLNALFQRTKGKLFMDMMHYHPKDTMIIMKMLKDTQIINIPNVKLGTCYEYFFNKEIENQHTSEADVIATEEIYLKIIEMLKILNF